VTHAVDTKDLAISALRLMATEDEAEFARLIHPAATNREGIDEPRECRGSGPSAYLATARWLHAAFSDLSWEVLDAVGDGDLVVLHGTMTGRHTGPFVAYGPDARPKVAFPATGRTFAVTQTHWFRIADGQVIEHWANRDDRGMGEQLGWTPPSPVYLVRMLLATRKARAAEA
jgi:predicted ester cyclase